MRMELVAANLHRWNVLHALRTTASTKAVGTGMRVAALAAIATIGASVLAAHADPKKGNIEKPSRANQTSSDTNVSDKPLDETGPTDAGIPDGTSCDSIKSGVEGTLTVTLGAARLEVLCDDRVIARCGPVSKPGKGFCATEKVTPPKTGHIRCVAITEKKNDIAQAECLDP